MKDLFSSLPVIHQRASPGYVQALIQIHRQELFTGLMVMCYPSQQILTLVFLEGLPLNLYECLEWTNRNIARQAWSDELNRSEASVSLLSLTVEELRFLQVTLDSGINRIERARMASSEFGTSLKLWATLEEASLVWAKSDQLSSLGLVVGFGDQTFERMDFRASSGHFSRSDLESMEAFAEGEYEVARYVCSSNENAWREYRLRLAFNPMMRMLINRFGELAGRILAERLCNQLSSWCADGGWRITFGSSGVTNQHFFETLDQAVNVYVSLVRRFQDESSLAIGPRLAENLFREVIGRMHGQSRGILIDQIFSRYGLAGVYNEV